MIDLLLPRVLSLSPAPTLRYNLLSHPGQASQHNPSHKTNRQDDQRAWPPQQPATHAPDTYTKTTHNDNYARYHKSPLSPRLANYTTLPSNQTYYPRTQTAHSHLAGGPIIV